MVIRVRHISKSFLMFDNPVQVIKDKLFGQEKVARFHALKNISFSANQGETLGIVGHNGSGKSTLLQIITGVMRADEGLVEVQGRVAALLELGSGFNPEFTGRENVFFSASLLGLTEAEINAKLDDILAFSAIGEFIDRPVKTYSSGMMLRLAFSVVINTDPDVLIVDEALAVGDDAFQRKCHARIKQLQSQGVTLLFVSHSAGQVIDLCDRAILLDKGEMLMEGSPKSVVHNYHKLLHMQGAERDEFRQQILTGNISNEPAAIINDEQDNSGQLDDNLVPTSTVWYQPNGAFISQPLLRNTAGQQVNLLQSGHQYDYCFHVEFTDDAFEVGFGMLIKTVAGAELTGATTTRNHEKRLPFVAKGQVIEVRFRFPCLLRNGTYFLNCGCSALVQGERRFLHRGVDAAMFAVVEENPDATGVIDFGIELHAEVIDEA
ncbi:ABC transporter ATP-binding protein [Motilimonas sp. 1_MG-2023]|uniref:ABC transporter ATP-binding protein n=1 Tax=Motilimonas sp. 1_MG-2023 TaxID=3062672 RepID=UPI0026E425B0|nr:ABC transporter ATP-binding protein [Motilimonas sp. 1_MG-2023]MDO6527431.1 ABC transporter ATP-binding protein [Motilimonas sp. 1_MG-2023]